MKPLPAQTEAKPEQHQCQNCSKLWTDDQIDHYVPDLMQRVEPGDIMPSGVCPDCGALVIPKETDQ